MADLIETPRTHLRLFEAADAETAFAWFSDPEVMRFIPRGPDTTLEHTQRRIAGYKEHQRVHGFSKRLMMKPISEVAMKLNRIVVMTTWLPRLACR